MWLSGEVELFFLGSGPKTSVAVSKFNHVGEGADEKENVIQASLQGQQTSSVKGHIVNILGFVVHIVSVVATQSTTAAMKAAIDIT